jgi:hypothetical protein
MRRRHWESHARGLRHFFAAYAAAFIAARNGNYPQYVREGFHLGGAG